MELLLVSKFQTFLLILARVLGIFVGTPFFSNRNIPSQVKGGLALFISFVLFPGLADNLGVKIPQEMALYAFLVSQELLIGLVIGFACNIMFTVFLLSGQFYSLQMGLGIINVMDPLSQLQLPIIGQLLSLYGLLIFLLVGGHHLVIIALHRSFEIVPTFGPASFGPLAKGLIDMFARMFAAAFMLGMPIIGVLFLCSVAMGLLSRAAPQMNIMMLGWPVNIFVGLFTLIILVPALFGIGREIFEELFAGIDRILYSLTLV